MGRGQEGMCATLHMWRSEPSLLKLAVCLYYVGSRDRTQFCQTWQQALSLLSHLADPESFYVNNNKCIMYWALWVLHMWKLDTNKANSTLFFNLAIKRISQVSFSCSDVQLKVRYFKSHNEDWKKIACGCLLCKNKDPSSEPHHLHKSCAWYVAIAPVLGEVKEGRFQGLAGQPV